jgi:hypothetical protein
MLDVHPPHEKIHGFRDFLLHMLTITLGLLIALGLEGCVEWNHHRHLRNEAEANLRQEIEDNQKDLAMVRASIDEEQKNLKEIAEALELRIEGKPINKSSLRFGMKIATLREASWETASSTGAFGYMEYVLVKRYAAVYQLQRQFVELQSLRLEKASDMLAYVALGDPAKLSTSDAGAALIEVHRAMSRLESMREIGDALDQTYSKTLKSE